MPKIMDISPIIRVRIINDFEKLGYLAYNYQDDGIMFTADRGYTKLFVSEDKIYKYKIKYNNLVAFNEYVPINKKELDAIQKLRDVFELIDGIDKIVKGFEELGYKNVYNKTYYFFTKEDENYKEYLYIYDDYFVHSWEDGDGIQYYKETTIAELMLITKLYAANGLLKGGLK